MSTLTNRFLIIQILKHHLSSAQNDVLDKTNVSNNESFFDHSNFETSPMVQNALHFSKLDENCVQLMSVILPHDDNQLESSSQPSAKSSTSFNQSNQV